LLKLMAGAEIDMKVSSHHLFVDASDVTSAKKNLLDYGVVNTFVSDLRYGTLIHAILTAR
jgi:hypothetical protein